MSDTGEMTGTTEATGGEATEVQDSAAPAAEVGDSAETDQHRSTRSTPPPRTTR